LAARGASGRRRFRGASIRRVAPLPVQLGGCRVRAHNTVAKEFAETAVTRLLMTPPSGLTGPEDFSLGGLMLLVYIGIGGLLGTLARYGLGGWVQDRAGTWMPWGTLTVNLTGSFVLGMVMQAAQGLPMTPELRGLLTIGFCGGFTTFSTLAYEAVTFIQQGQWGRAVLYTAGSVAAGLIALVAGLVVGQSLARTGG
jgi:fluoride exporter